MIFHLCTGQTGLIKFITERTCWHISIRLGIRNPHPSFHLLSSFTVEPGTHLAASAHAQVYEEPVWLHIGAHCNMAGVLIREQGGCEIEIGDDVSIEPGTNIKGSTNWKRCAQSRFAVVSKCSCLDCRGI